ncbi:MAG TPA: hypothetical protein VI298_06115 [Geobacteraceae bacterium]
MSTLTMQEWQKICFDTVNRMIDHVAPFVTPISKVLSDTEGEHHGTGSYFEIDSTKFVITNEHVARHLSRQALTHQFLGNENIIRLTNPAYCIPAPVDIAISRIEENIWCKFKHDSLAIPISRFAKKHAPVGTEVLFFAGYSGERSKFLFGNLISRGTPYLTQESPFPSKVKEADANFHFSLHYPPDLAISVDGSSHLPNPHGFSGSLVWDTKRVACLHAEKEWHPEMAEVTGILWGWPSSVACILATKVEHMDLNQLAGKAICSSAKQQT